MSAGGGSLLRVIRFDVLSLAAPAIEVDTSLPGLRVIRTLQRAIELHGKPKTIVMDSGPEFTCKALDQWAWSHAIELHWIDPGKPIQNAFAESFNGASAKSARTRTPSSPSTTHER